MTSVPHLVDPQVTKNELCLWSWGQGKVAKNCTVFHPTYSVSVALLPLQIIFYRRLPIVFVYFLTMNHAVQP